MKTSPADDQASPWQRANVSKSPNEFTAEIKKGKSLAKCEVECEPALVVAAGTVSRYVEPEGVLTLYVGNKPDNIRTQVLLLDKCRVGTCLTQLMDSIR